MNSYTAVASLAEMSHAVEMEHRMTAVEAILPTLATKADVAELRVDVEKGQKENRAWMLGTVLALVACFGAMFYAIQSSTDKNIDRMDRRIDRMDRRIEQFDRRIEQFEQFMRSQRVEPAPIAPTSDVPESPSSADSSE